LTATGLGGVSHSGKRSHTYTGKNWISSVKYVAPTIITAIIVPPLLLLAAIWDISRYWAKAHWDWED
jgi:hypothetical protein